MREQAQVEVTDLEILEDLSATARCDEGYLKLRRLRCQNRHADGSTSPVFRVDVVDRPKLDAVGVVIYRRTEMAIEVLTRQTLRPAAYFRKDKDMTVPDNRSHLFVEEIVAGVLEAEDKGEAGLRARAAAETFEEGGFEVSPDEIWLLGGPFFVAPGIISEKIFLAAVDVTSKKQRVPEGDGSPLEEGCTLRWRKLEEAISACSRGEIQDAKTEIGFGRFRAELVATGRSRHG